jgi:signal transduction histidine kinase/CheY-like chemotaxis protein
MPNQIQVLILEDSQDDAEQLARILTRAGFEPLCQQVETEREYLQALRPELDLILADYNLPWYNARLALDRLKERELDVPFIVVSGAISEEDAVECMRYGASDYLLKDRLARLGQAVTQALEQRRLRAEKRRAEDRYRRIVETANEGIWLVDAAGLTEYVNVRMAEMLDYTVAEMLGRPASDFVTAAEPSDNSPISADAFPAGAFPAGALPVDAFPEGAFPAGAFPVGAFPFCPIPNQESSEGAEPGSERLPDGALIPFEARCLRKDGARVAVLIATRSRVDDKGLEGGALAMVTDITVRVQAEREILRRNRELGALNAIAAASSSSLNLPDLFATVEGCIATQPDVAAGLLLLYDEPSGKLYLRREWNLPAMLAQRWREAPECIPHSVRIIRHLEAILMPEMDWSAALSGLGARACRKELQNWRSCIEAPLTANGRPQGIVMLFSRAPAEFTAAHLAFYTAVGQQVGVAVYNARLFEQLRSAHNGLRRLSRKLVEVQDAERRHLARELHDEVGQTLTGLKLMLETATRLPPADKERRIEAVRELVSDLTGRVRRLSRDLRPALLDDAGLIPALQALIDRYSYQTGVRVDLEHRLSHSRRFAVAIETVCYRIVQEALTNTARHGSTQAASVLVWTEGDRLCVQVEDSGVGFDPGLAIVSTESSGLAGMQERVVLLGGELTIDSRPGSGTRVLALLPAFPEPEAISRMGPRTGRAEFSAPRKQSSSRGSVGPGGSAPGSDPSQPG